PVAVADRETLSLPAERLPPPPPPLPARRPMPAMSALTDRHTGPNAANPFEAKEPGFSERLAQIEKTRSNIVLPDLRRPPPTLGSGAPPLEVAKASRPAASAASTLIDAGAPPKPPLTPEPAAAPDEPDGGRLVGDTASEADVQIVMVDSEQRDRPAVGLEAISITDTDGPPEPPPSFWKRRGRRSMSDDTASTQRATGPIEEASVHIIHANTDRPPPVSTRNDLDHVATPTEPDDRTRKKARQRFLQALIGTTEKS
ncbi:MAG: hypothetical protein ACR2PA_19150, partial [Hyphomicrobiaceae bacterium]